MLTSQGKPINIKSCRRVRGSVSPTKAQAERCIMYLRRCLFHHNGRHIHLDRHLLNYRSRPAGNLRHPAQKPMLMLMLPPRHALLATSPTVLVVLLRLRSKQRHAKHTQGSLQGCPYVKCRWLRASSLVQSAENWARAACRTSSSCRTSELGAAP